MILVYSVGPPEIVDPLIYDGLVEELVEVLEIKGADIMEIKAAVLRTLTAIIHLERDPRYAQASFEWPVCPRQASFEWPVCPR